MSRSEPEKGAIAVEMAILLPVLILLLLGMMEFGRALNTQATLSHAAREGVRVMAISGSISAAQAKARAAAPMLNPEVALEDVQVVACPATTDAVDSSVSVTIHYELSTLTGIAGPFDMTAKAVMLCGG